MSSLIVEVVRVNTLTKHPNADTLWIAQIKGWNCIVKEGQFKVGDLAIFIPIDAVLPEKMIEEYKLDYLKNGRRVKTVKLRGYISQGLLLPVPPDKNWVEGQNVAEELGITKWEPPTPTYAYYSNFKGSKRNPNPNFKKYTDIENINNYPEIFKPGELVVITEKIHGTNFRVGNVPIEENNWWARIKAWFGGRYEFVVGSRNVQLSSCSLWNKKKVWYSEDVYTKIAKRYKLDQILPKDHILFGEIYGKGIQDLTYGLEDIDVVFFDLMVNGKYVDYYDFVSFCSRFNLPTVPLIYIGEYMPSLLTLYTCGNSLLCPSQMREGAVIKPLKETIDPRIGRKILKSINPDYLLRKGATEYH